VPTPAPITPEQLRDALLSPAGRTVLAELLPTQTAPAAQLDDRPPFELAYGPPKSEQVQLRFTERERELYERAAKTPSLWPEGRSLPMYEALRRLAWEGARARGLTVPASAG
jgi:hypothetical protein